MNNENKCPTCHELLVYPREGYCYCEDCGWPDEDFGEEYIYPKIGERLESYQPGLEFYDYKQAKWITSGVIAATMKEAFRGFYRKKA